tara:strand:- start:27 stop:203 length:177 start_codon:yes stop_codon:yes gene_type:complete
MTFTSENGVVENGVEYFHCGDGFSPAIQGWYYQIDGDKPVGPFANPVEAAERSDSDEA